MPGTMRKSFPLDKRPGYKTSKINTGRALALKTTGGLSYAEIGKVYGVTGAAVRARIEHLLPSEEDVKSIEAFNKFEAQILAEKRSLMLDELTPEVIRNMWMKHPGSAGLIMNSLFNNQRILEGKSISDTDRVHILMMQFKDAKQEMEKAAREKIINVTPDKVYNEAESPSQKESEE